MINKLVFEKEKQERKEKPDIAPESSVVRELREKIRREIAERRAEE